MYLGERICPLPIVLFFAKDSLHLIYDCQTILIKLLDVLVEFTRVSKPSCQHLEITAVLDELFGKFLLVLVSLLVGSQI